MGCLFIILIVLVVSVVIYVIKIGVAVLPFAALFFLITSYIAYRKSKKLGESKMQCPNCGSTNVKITSLTTGSQTQTSMSGSGSSFFGIGFVEGNKSTNTAYSFKREAICQECGFNYDYLTVEDTNNIKKQNKTRLIYSIIFFIIALIIAIIFLFTTTSDEVINNDNSIWASEYTSLDDFDYYLDGNQVYLKKYEGNDKKIKISSVYEKDGKQYNVVEFAEGVFALENVTSVILPEGLKKIPENTFNSSGVKYIYIPASLEPDGKSYSFYNYFDDIETIYYGGSEEEWKILTNNTARAKIDVKEIKYNSDINNLK